MAEPLRQTKIVATLGPATESEKMLAKLILAGVDILRLNMAHGSHQWVRDTISRVRKVTKAVGRQAAVMMDVKGPEIRTGFLDTPLELSAGDLIEFYVEGTTPAGDIPAVSVNYPGLIQELSLGDSVLVDSGLINLRVVRKGDGLVRLEVLNSGTLGSRRHINLPGIQVHLPALTEKDYGDLRVGVEMGIDFVALSFVREAADVVTLRNFLKELRSAARIIAKIEDQAGVRNMKAIIREADGVMVARGDLGVEIDYFKLPLIQTELIQACHADGKPVIIATHMLESMINSPMPTRAEVSDVSLAIREQADAVMLSGETTTGSYPIESVEAFKNIIRSIEPTVKLPLNQRIELKQPKAKMLRSAVVLAQELGNSAILVFTRSGFLAYVLASLRAQGIPIFAFTDDEALYRQLFLPWGVEPYLMEFCEDPEQTIVNAMRVLKNEGRLASGVWLPVITNALAHGKVIDSLQLRQIPED